MAKHAYYASLEIVQGGKCYRCDLPYKSLSNKFEQKEVIEHFYSVFSHPINRGIVKMYGMTAYDFAVDILVNENDSVANYDLSWLFSVDCWQKVSCPRAHPYQHRLNLLGLLDKHYETVYLSSSDIPTQVEYRSGQSGLKENP